MDIKSNITSEMHQIAENNRQVAGCIHVLIDQGLFAMQYENENQVERYHPVDFHFKVLNKEAIWRILKNKIGHIYRMPETGPNELNFCLDLNYNTPPDSPESSSE